MQSRELKFGKATLSKNVLLYLEDVTSHLLSMHQSLELQDKILDRALNGYLAQINLGISQASYRLNITMKQFTAGACIFLPLTLIASIMGVNVRVPFQEEDSIMYFMILLGIMASVAILLMFLGRWRNWFG